MQHPIGVDLFDGVCRCQAETLSQALLGHLPQVGDGGMAIRDRETGHLVTTQNVVVLNFFSDGDGIGNRLLHHLRLEVISEEVAHLLFRFEVFGAGVAKALFVTDQLARQHAQKRIMGLHIIAGEVVGIVGGNNLDAQFIGDLHDLHVDDAIFRGAVVLNLEVEIVSENTLIPAGHIARHIRSFAHDGLWDLTAQAGCGHDQTFGILSEQMLVHAGA
ncbi:MAG: Uncharacterised protein [Cyanobium sp. ARS6]|nr:MAG: Uncharacterised protein [Cyanobium sp. ARS6]